MTLNEWYPILNEVILNGVISNILESVPGSALSLINAMLIIPIWVNKNTANT